MWNIQLSKIPDKLSPWLLRSAEDLRGLLLMCRTGSGPDYLVVFIMCDHACRIRCVGSGKIVKYRPRCPTKRI